MTAVTEAALLEALKSVVDPHTGRGFVSARQVKNLKIEGDEVAFDVELGYPAKSQFAGLRRQFVAAARSVPGVGN
ncbi:MAG: iron-sulfur cluster assembly protein, partial [Aquabacterium sp.]|nr:iron-sulfur cluster assembly protein [Aquabacterium sp.]